mmetsp:Transcript_27163/g.48749  ORF Transcript_27163/g.48749 Transcript_27163/m.48749 type:complete len:174 (+) Transcript_27163:51-572(+)
MDPLGPPPGLAIRFQLEDNISITSSKRSLNSFLHETDHNSSIPDDVRDLIEQKYKKSVVNTKYRFPRVKKKMPRGTSTASTSESLTKKPCAPFRRHMRTRSDIPPALVRFSPYAAPVKNRLSTEKIRPQEGKFFTQKRELKALSMTPSPLRSAYRAMHRKLPVLYPCFLGSLR